MTYCPGLYGTNSKEWSLTWKLVWIQSFPSPWLVVLPSLILYLPIAARRGPRALMQSEMHPEFEFGWLIPILFCCYIITEWFFLYKSFFINYIFSFSLVGLWTIWLLVQVHRHWVQFTLVHGGYDNTNCHNKPQIGNETGVWMTSCPEAMDWEFGYFEKHVSWVLAVGQSNW